MSLSDIEVKRDYVTLFSIVESLRERERDFVCINCCYIIEVDIYTSGSGSVTVSLSDIEVERILKDIYTYKIYISDSD